MKDVAKETKEFLIKVRNERKEKLLGLSMDIGYFKFLKASMDEDKFRTDLKTERSKYELNKKGKPGKFVGDKEKVQSLEAVIDKIDGLKVKIDNFEALYLDLSKYINFIDNLDDATADRLIEVHDKFSK